MPTEERIAAAVSTALCILLIAFVGFFAAFGFASALPVLLYGLGCVALAVAVAHLLGRIHPLLQILVTVIPAASAALLIEGVLPRYIAMGMGVVVALIAERSVVTGNPPQSVSVRYLSPLLALFVSAAGVWFFSRTNNRPQEGALVTLAVIGAVWLVVALFLLNRYSLRQAARADAQQDVPAGARRAGLAGTLALMALAFLLASIGPIARAISTLFDSIGGSVAAFVSWLLKTLFSSSSKPAPDTTPTPTGGMEQIPMDGANAPAWFQILMTVLSYVIALAILCLIVYGLSKLLPRVWKDISSRLRTVFATWRDDAQDYRDRAESLMTLRQALGDARKQIDRIARRFRRKPRLEDFPTNGERVRFLFREFLLGLKQRGKQPRPGDTPGEIAASGRAPGSDDLADAYNLTRYALQEPGDDAVERARRFVEEK